MSIVLSAKADEENYASAHVKHVQKYWHVTGGDVTFSAHRCTADRSPDLASSLEEARTTRQTAHVVFNDIHRAFIPLPLKTNIDRLQNSEACVCALQYLPAFLDGRTMTMDVRGCMKTNLHITQAVRSLIILRHTKNLF